MHTHSPKKPKKFKKRFLLESWWDRKGVLMVEFMQQGTTITPEVYCETLKILRRTIESKSLGILTSGVVFLLDDAPPHTAARTRALLEHFNWELFDHHPYSPDLAPSYYRLLTTSRTGCDHSASTIMRSLWKVSKRSRAHRRQASLT
jgi:transposase